MRSTIPRWRVWPPSRALELERGEQFEEPLSNEPRAFTSEIDPRYPVFGNPLTSTVRRNFAAAREEIEALYRRIAELEADTGFTLSANLPLTGTGTTANPLRVIPATQLQVNGGTDGIYPVTPATLRALTGDVGSLNTAASTVTGAINELLTRISALSSPLLLVGTYNAAAHIVLASAGSPAITGALPAAAPGNRGWVLIVSVAGTGAPPAPTVPLTASDWLVSDGAVWIHLDLHQPTTHAVNVAISTITGLVATNVQTALEELRLALINVLTTVAVNAPITGNGAATPLGLTVASAADIAGGIDALNPITSLTLRGVTGNIASLTTTDKTSLVAAINEVADEVALATTGGLTSVATNASLSGTGTSTSPLAVAPASTAQVAAGTDNIQAVTALRMHEVTGDLATLTTAIKTNLVAAINALQDDLDDFEPLPVGGAAGEVLIKISATDGDAGWASPTVATAAPLTGNGATTPIGLTVANAAQVTAGSDALHPVTPQTLRGVTGDLATLTTTAKSNLVAAVNELDDTIANLDLGVSTNASLTGDGTSGSSLQIAPASAAQVTAGSDNIQAITSLRLHEVTGTLALLDTTDKSALVPAMNELATHIATLQSGVTPIGTYDVTTDVVTPFSGSPFGATPGPLPAAATGNKGWYAIVSPNAGTGLGTSEIAGVTVAIGDQLLSSGTSWDHIVLSAATTPASSVAIDPIAGMTAATAQQALAELHTNKLATVAVSAPITGNGAGTPLGLSVAGAGDVATGTNNTLPITSATLRGVTGDPAGLTTTVTTNLVGALNGLQTEVDDRLTGNETVTLSGDVTGSGATAITTTLATVNSNTGTFQGITVNAKGQVTAAADQSYLTGNQTVTLSGDVSGSGTTAITATLADVNSTVGTFQGLTVNAKGLVTAASNQSYLTANQTITLSGDASGSGTTAITVTLPDVNTNTGTFQGITVNAKGQVTAASDQAYAPLASPALTGTPTAPTATAGTDTTQVATTAFVKAAVDAIDALPTGGSIYDVLSKASATDGDVEWRGAGVRPNNEIVIGNTTGNGSNTITLGNTAVTALYTRAGFVLNNATGGSQGPGTVNASGPLHVNGQKIGGFAPSIAWAEGTDPDGISMFINNTGRTLSVLRISGVVEVPNGSDADVSVVKAAPLAALAAGTEVHTSTPFDADGNVGEVQELIPALDNTLPPDWRLGLQAGAITGWDDSVAVITVYLE